MHPCPTGGAARAVVAGHDRTTCPGNGRRAGVGSARPATSGRTASSRAGKLGAGQAAGMSSTNQACSRSGAGRRTRPRGRTSRPGTGPNVRHPTLHCTWWPPSQARLTPEQVAAANAAPHDGVWVGMCGPLEMMRTFDKQLHKLRFPTDTSSANGSRSADPCCAVECRPADAARRPKTGCQRLSWSPSFSVITPPSTSRPTTPNTTNRITENRLRLPATGFPPGATARTNDGTGEQDDASATWRFTGSRSANGHVARRPSCALPT
jgi:hypothetical protein